MTTLLRQGDPKWSNIRIGHSATTLAESGCTITSLCMALEKLRGFIASPADAARYWTFNNRGEILWPLCNFRGANFVWRGHSFNLETITKFANEPNKAVIIEVNNRRHWLYCESVRGKTLVVCDPIDGQHYLGLPAKYTVTGYALFEKDMKTPPDWAADEWKQAQEKIDFLKTKQAGDMMSLNDIQECLVDLNKIKQVGEMPAYRLAVILSSLGLLD